MKGKKIKMSITPEFGPITGNYSSANCTAAVAPYQMDKQPPVQFFQDPDCTGGTNVMNDNAVYDDLYDLQYVGHNTITTMIIPPNMRLEVKDRKDDNNKIWNDLEANKNQFWATRFGPGTYDLRQPATPSKCINCNQPDTNLYWNDRIVGAKVNAFMPWNDYLKACCTGKITPTGQCKNFADPNGGDCRQLMLRYCDSPSTFFTPECKTYLQNAAPTEAGVNTIAKAQCPSAQSQVDKDWCSCYDISSAPPGSSAEVKGIWPCLQQTCNDATKSLQPNAKRCPNTLTICQQSNITTELNQSTVGKQAIQNACGNINLGPPATTTPATPGATTPPTTPATTTPDATPTATPGTTTTPSTLDRLKTVASSLLPQMSGQTIAIIVGVVIAIVVLIVILIMLFKGRAKPPQA